MSAEQLIDLLRIKATPEQLRACRYLENRGQSFCVHFGIDNAIEKARADWNARRRAKRVKATTRNGRRA